MMSLVAMLGWPLVALVAFSTIRPSIAVSVTVFGGVLLLPGNHVFDLPMVPDIDRFRMATLSALVAGLVLRPASARVLRGSRVYLAFLVLLVASSAMTVVLNGDPLVLPAKSLPAMTLHDLISVLLNQVLDVAVPFLLGLLFFRRRQDLIDLILCVVMAGLLYAPLILFELRMSPKLHRMVYGAVDSGFGMTMRFGGWRPMVFLPHGLALAMFVLTVACASVVAARSGLKRIIGVPWELVAAFQAVLLVACKSMASIVYGALMLPVLAFLRPIWVARIASLAALLVLTYPALRVTGWFPAEQLVEAAARVDPLRGESLAFRFENEDLLLAKVALRPWFGWGTWGRDRNYDPVTGEDLSTTDGRWIISFGQHGAVGFFAIFGLLVAPVFAVWWNLHRIRSRTSRSLLAGSAIVLIVNAVDLLPNAFLLPSTLLLSGALASLVPGILREQASGQREARVPVEARVPDAAGVDLPARLGEGLFRGARRRARS